MRNNPNSVWTVELMERLVDLQKRGWSCAQIAAELGHGVSRNAVIGKLHRMGITGNSHAISEQERIRRSRAAIERKRDERNARRRERRREFRELNPRREAVPLLTCTEVEPLSISLLDLNPGDCRYPDGEGACITFCGHPALAGRSYCGPHALLSLDQTKTRTRAEYALYKRQNLAKHKRDILEAAE